jgi:hypothetical protein
MTMAGFELRDDIIRKHFPHSPELLDALYAEWDAVPFPTATPWLPNPSTYSPTTRHGCPRNSGYLNHPDGRATDWPTSRAERTPWQGCATYTPHSPPSGSLAERAGARQKDRWVADAVTVLLMENGYTTRRMSMDDIVEMLAWRGTPIPRSSAHEALAHGHGASLVQLGQEAWAAKECPPSYRNHQAPRLNPDTNPDVNPDAYDPEPSNPVCIQSDY